MSCHRPCTKKDGTIFPCGHCSECVYRHAAGWAFRLMIEERNSISSQFITFTYDTTNLNYSPTGLQTLCKTDMQNFFKRLRKCHAQQVHRKPGIKYYAVGEYGSKTKRPHYHAIIFNADENLIELAWSKRRGEKLPVPIGEIYYGDVTGHSIGYTLKYIQKGKIIPQYPGDDRERECSLISKGIGLAYLTPNMRKWHQADIYNRGYLTLDGGQKVAMPRYYYEKLYDGYERDLLKMSGSLIRQDEFFKYFSEGFTERVKKSKLYQVRINAADRRLKQNNSKLLKI